MAKYGCGLLGHGALSSAVSQKMNEWIELIFCMLMHSVSKAKSYFGYASGRIWL